MVDDDDDVPIFAGIPFPPKPLASDSNLVRPESDSENFPDSSKDRHGRLSNSSDSLSETASDCSPIRRRLPKRDQKGSSRRRVRRASDSSDEEREHLDSSQLAVLKAIRLNHSAAILTLADQCACSAQFVRAMCQLLLYNKSTVQLDLLVIFILTFALGSRFGTNL